jgi:hypothetical protein
MFGGLFKSFRSKSKEEVPKSSHAKQNQQQQQQRRDRGKSTSEIEPTMDPDRSLSDAGPMTGLAPPPPESLERVRSKSLSTGGGTPFSHPSSSAGVGGPSAATVTASSSKSEAPVTVASLDEQLQRLDTQDTIDAPFAQMEPVQSMISRHDQYRAPWAS